MTISDKVALDNQHPGTILAGLLAAKGYPSLNAWCRATGVNRNSVYSWIDGRGGAAAEFALEITLGAKASRIRRVLRVQR